MDELLFVVDAMWDAALDYLADNADRLFLCSATPTTYAEASTTYNLATRTMTVGDGNGDYTIEAGDPSGRALAIAALDGVEIDTSGDITCIALCKSGTTALLCVIPLADAQSVTAGKLLNMAEGLVRLDLGLVA